MYLPSYFVKKHLSAVQTVVEMNRVTEGAKRDAGLEYDNVSVQHAMVHTRDDMAGTMMLTAFIVAELQFIRWVIIAIGVALLFK